MVKNLLNCRYQKIKIYNSVLSLDVLPTYSSFDKTSLPTTTDPDDRMFVVVIWGGNGKKEQITVPDMYSTTFMEPNTPYFLRMIKEYSSELFESEEIQIRTQAATHPFPGGISRTRLHPVYATSFIVAFNIGYNGSPFSEPDVRIYFGTQSFSIYDDPLSLPSYVPISYPGQNPVTVTIGIEDELVQDTPYFVRMMKEYSTYGYGTPEITRQVY